MNEANEQQPQGMSAQTLMSRARQSEAGGVPVDWKTIADQMYNAGAAALEQAEKRIEELEGECASAGLREAGRLDLSLESLVLQPRFRSFFTKEELAEAKRRLDMVPDYAKRIQVAPDENHPDDLQDEKEYVEGAKKRITVNAYELDQKARKACLKRHGYRCAVCTMNFQEVYGEVGKQFIHVHHRKPLAGRRTDYTVKPTIDLVPVCPNCHAMLHTSNPPLGIAELKQKLDESVTRMADKSV